MKKVIRILVLSALLVGAIEALAAGPMGPIPWNPPTAGPMGPIPWNPPAK